MSERKWGTRSKIELSTVRRNLKRVMDHALSTGIIDMSAIQGRRPKNEQNKYFNEGRSKVKWPNSKHNVANLTDLASGIDVAPNVNGISWNKLHCCVMAGVILSSAHFLGVKIRWGGNWDMDREPITDQDFQDLVHFELVEE